METLLGFSIGFWDYITFLVLFILGVAGLALGIFILGLPGRIAIAAQSPRGRRGLPYGLDRIPLQSCHGFKRLCGRLSRPP